MEKVIPTLIALVLLFISFEISGQTPGTNDVTFNPYDIGFGNGDGFDGTVLSSSVQNDDKIIVTGSFSMYNTISRKNIVRLNADCSLDTNFKIGTGANNSIYTSLVQSDGKILIGGAFVSYNGYSINRLARLKTDGKIDSSFNNLLGANNFVRSMSLQSDGKIIITGDFTTYYNLVTANRIVRVNANGTGDPTFIIGAGADNTVRASAIQSDGKIIIGGDFLNYKGTSANRIVRINTNGDPDTTFHYGTGANSSIYSINIQNDNKIIIAGNFTSYNGISVNRVVRLNSNGTIDPTFNVGTGANSAIMGSTLQIDGKLIIAGDFTDYNGVLINRVAKLNTNGSIDSLFKIGSGANSSARAVSLQSNGNIILLGDFYLYNDTALIRMAHLNPNGSIVSTFDLGTGVNRLVYSTAIQADGKIVVGGFFGKYNSKTCSSLVRANQDGSVDQSFDVGKGVTGGPIYSLAIQTDGKIIIVGDFTKYHNTFINRIARLNTNGSIDTTFYPGSGADAYIKKVLIQPDGKIMIAGLFYSYNGVTSNHIRRLNSDGTIDPSFNIGTGANGTLLSLAIQSDGKIITGGYAGFNNYNGTAVNRLARLNTNGSIDNSFSLGAGATLPNPANYIYSIQMQSDGKIIPAGYYSISTGTTTYYSVMRLNQNGNIDNTYNVGTGLNGSIYTATMQSDDKLLIGGNFISYNGTQRNSLARLKSNGNIDSTFVVGSGTNNYVMSISIQNDNKIILAGDFTSYNSIGRNRIARVENDLVTGITEMKNSSEAVPLIFPNPGNGLYSIMTHESCNMNIFDITGRLIISDQLKEGVNQLNLINQRSGIYLLRIITNNKCYSLKVIKE